jgi:hypothetical protein
VLLYSVGMTDYKQLKAAAVERRDLELEKISREYHCAMMAIRSLERSMRTNTKPTPSAFRNRAIRPADPDSSYRLMTTVQAGEAVLREGQPMTLVEIVMEIMDRGHRSYDQPRAVLHALRGSFRYHKGKFTQDAEGRWGVA